MTGSCRIGALWRSGRDRLMAAGVEGASLDARLLAQFAFQKDALGLALEDRHIPDMAQRDAFDAMLQRRLAREPVARIIGRREFYGLDFELNKDTLVPRPETEQVVDLGIEMLRNVANPNILDLGTGSGCIAIALLAHLPNARVLGVDISAGALEQSVYNAHLHGVADRFDVLQGSWFEPVAGGAVFDLIVSNPPYIAHDDIARLQPDVRLFDPVAALDGGHDGYEAYRVIADQGLRHLRLGGSIVVEHGAGQRGLVEELFGEAGYASTRGHDDLAGHDRIVVAFR